ncbi:MAG: PAS domain S-box protein [SAR202 cluster bacterium]|nr:PAS domain S-box protein [SAR202 cluster bacterium]
MAEFYDSVFGLGVVSMRLRDPRGDVIWNSPRSVAVASEDSRFELQDAIDQHVILSRLLTGTLMSGDVGGQRMDVVRTYHPIRDVPLNAPVEGATLGGLEIDQDVTAALADARQTSRVFAIVGSFSMGAVLFTLLFLIVLRADRTIGRNQKRLLSQQKAIEESEALYRAVVENAHDAIVITTDTERIFVNAAFLRLMGFTDRVQALAAPLYSFVVPEDREDVKDRTMARRRGDMPPGMFDFRIQRADKDIRTVQATAVGITYRGQVATLSMLRDVTDQMRAQVALRTSERRFRTIYESSPLGICIVDAQGVFTQANDSFTRMLGYTEEELRSLRFREITHPDDVPRNLGLFERLVAGNLPHYGMEKRYIRKDGGLVWVHMNVSAMPHSDPEFRCVALLEDITERKKAEAALDRSEAQLHLQSSALAAAANGIVITDTEGIVVWTNGAFSKMTGYSRDEVIGNTLRLLKSGKQDDDYYARLWKAIKSGQNWEGEVINRRKDGTLYTEFQTITPVKSPAGEITHFIAIKQDITERKDTEKRLQETSRLVSIGELAAGVAHELNNPLTGVMGFSELLMHEDLPAQTKEDVRKIYTSAQRAARIVQNLLSFARRHEPEKKYIDVRGVVHQVLELKAYDLKSGKVKVTTDMPDGLPPTMADQHQLVQVVLNIVSNAEQAILSSRGTGNILVSTSTHAGRIRISIKDDGPGIPQQLLGRIFDPFFTTKEVGKGTGLGLSICYGIVRQHNGDLTVESVPGQGATFNIDLPIIDQSGQPAAAEVSAVVEMRGHKRILVIDDEGTIRELVNRMLTLERFEVDVADSGEQGLMKVHGRRYDGILLDMKMPGMTGQQVYRHIREYDQALSRRVVFMTGDTLSPDTKDFITASRNPAISKPFSRETLLAAISSTASEEPAAGR